MRGITKVFPGVVANDNVDLDVRYGEVHTLLGENGAGKSTLVKILFGLYKADEGSILLRGQPIAVGSPSEAIASRIGMIHQHFMLVPTFDRGRKCGARNDLFKATLHRPRRCLQTCL